jgi:hypothetical protein
MLNCILISVLRDVRKSMASKTNVTGREKVKIKHMGRCGDEVVRVLVSPVKGKAKLRWYCEKHGYTGKV